MGAWPLMCSPVHCPLPLWRRCAQDFYNLVDVYLDAVFFPNCVRDEKTFQQEGWHYELNEPSEEITYKGTALRTVLYRTALCRAVLYRTVLYCTALHCGGLYWVAQ